MPGIVTLLVTLTQTTSDPGTVQWCAFAMYLLVKGGSCPAAMLEHGVLPCLIMMCDKVQI